MLVKLVNFLIVVSMLFFVVSPPPVVSADGPLGSCSSENPGFKPDWVGGPYCSPDCGNRWVIKGGCNPWPNQAPQPVQSQPVVVVQSAPQPILGVTPAPMSPAQRCKWWQLWCNIPTPVTPAPVQPVFQTPGVTPAPRPTVIATVTPQPGVEIKIFRWPSAGEALVIVPIIAGVAFVDDISFVGIFDDPVAIVAIAGVGLYAVGTVIINGQAAEAVVQGYDGLIAWAGGLTASMPNPTPPKAQEPCLSLTDIQMGLWKTLTSGGLPFGDSRMFEYMQKSSVLTAQTIIDKNLDLYDVSKLTYYRQTFDEMSRGICWDFGVLEPAVKNLGRMYGYNIP